MSPPRRASMLRALQHRNYRLFFGGQSVSVVGTWITRIAVSWLVYRLTGSALLLGVVGFCGQIPTLILAPWAGVLVDRWDRHRILLATQVCSMLQSLALAVLALSGIITVTEIIILQLMQGTINSFDTPARQAFVIAMVEDRSDLPNAIALNSSMVTGSRIIGPSIGGVLIAAFGEGWCFMVDAISYVAVIISLLAMHITTEKRTAVTRILDEMRDGIRYVWGFKPTRMVLLLLALVSTLGMPYMVLMPAVAEDVLHGGAHTLGFLLSASGLGALIGALYLATRASVLGLGRAIAIAAMTFGAGLMAFSLSHTLWLSLLLLPIVGGGFMVQTASTNTILQTIVPEQLRGRVMAFYAVAILGTAPIGSLVAGVVADHIGVPWTIFMGGLACIASGIWFWLRLPAIGEMIRPIYIDRGIIPAGIPDAEAEAI